MKTGIRRLYTAAQRGRSRAQFCILHSAFCIAAFAVSAANAAEWFVSPGGSDSAAGTETAPFRTIKYAIGQAASDDTITLLPGDYAEGSDIVNSLASRVNVTKPLTIRSKDGRASRDTTRIVGAYDATATSPMGMGANAVRCVRITQNGTGTRFEGVTFYRGSTDYNGNSGAEKSEGGGAYVANGAKATFVDCAFVECQSTRGGAIYTDSNDTTNVKAVRCLFKRCRDTKFGAAMRGGAAWFCVFDDCGTARNSSGTVVGEQGNAKNAMSYCHQAVNCTFVNNEGYGVTMAFAMSGGVYNCLFQNNCDGAIGTENTAKTGGNTANIAYNTARMEVFSPFDCDYRLTADATARTAGSTGNLSKIPEEFRNTDFNGNAIDTSGATIAAGAVQEALTEVASGVGLARTSEGSWTLGGEPVAVVYRTWRGTIGWPVPQKVGFIPAAGRALVELSIGTTSVWPLPDDTAWVHPHRSGIAQTVGQLSTVNIYYADPVNGDDDNSGTEAAPFKTLNKAVQASMATHVVYAKSGDYANATVSSYGVGNRVVVPVTFAGSLRVVAVDGPESTFISGKAGTGNATYGTGADAVRCIAVNSTNAYRAAFQGFTIRDGHADVSGNIPNSYGGAIRNLNANGSDLGTAYLLDCVVKDCMAHRGGAVAGGDALRCKFVNCLAADNEGGVFRQCDIVSSLIDGCGLNSVLFARAGSIAYNCTIVNSTAAAISTANGAARLYNCVVGFRKNGYNALNSSTGGGAIQTLYDTVDSGTMLGEGCVQENPVLFQDVSLGNYRLRDDSAGHSLASTANLKSCMDLNGNPFAFGADGNYQAGCYAPRFGGSRTIHVDAAGGSDASGDGTDEAPFATLAAGMAAAEYGDTVLVLPGTYSTGTAVPSRAQAGGSVTPTIASRVVVKTGVTLASRDGAAATTIHGATATGGGCGNDAVRCVFLCKDATLRGFTLTGGHTAATALADGSQTMTVDNYGGGVAGYLYGNGNSASPGELSGLVENCVITGNQALRGGGAQFGVYRNCVFTDNTSCANKPGYALARARAEGCYFVGNGTVTEHSTAYCCSIVNCTVLGGQAMSSGAILNEGDYIRKCTMVNSVILANKINFYAITNCVFGTATMNSYNGTPATNNIIVGHAQLDADGVPLAGSSAIDAGDGSFCPAEFLAGFDPAGTRRVLNSVIDIGAFEYDWGVPWGKAVGGRRLVIDDMPSDSALGSNGKSLVFGGAEVPVSMTWTGNGNGAPYSFTASVTGLGTLTVTANGETLATLTVADGATALRFSSSLASNSLVFSYDGADGDGVTLSAFSNQTPFVMTVR